MDGHHGNGFAIFRHRVHIGTQRYPFHEVRQGICLKCAHGRLVVCLGRIFCRRGLEQRISIVVRLGIFVYYAKELLDVLDATSSVVGVLCFKNANKARLVHNGFDHLAQVAGIALSLVDECYEFRDGLARCGAYLIVGNAQLSSLQERDARFASNVVDVLYRGFANAALGHVDNAMSSNIVSGVDHQVQVRHYVADFRAIEEARTADKPIRHTGAHQHIFKHTALRIGAIEHGNLVVRHAFAVLMLNFRGDPTALVAFVGCAVYRDLVARRLRSEQLFGLARKVVGDNRICRRQDIAHGAVVFFQLHHAGFRVVFLEIEDIAQVSATPRVN